MGLGPQVYMAWFAVVAAAMVVAVIHLVRKPRSVVLALSATLGALLSWGLVSAYIGACEIDGYAGSKGFAASLAVGNAGLALFVCSCARVRQRLKGEAGCGKPGDSAAVSGNGSKSSGSR